MPPVLPADHGRCAGSNTLHKKLEFESEGVHFLHRRLFEHNSPLVRSRPDFSQHHGPFLIGLILSHEPEHLGRPFRKIDREICILLKQAHLPHLPLRYSAGGHIGDTSVLELKTRVRDIHTFRDDSDAVRFHSTDRRLDKAEDQIDVVDHQVQDDRDVRPAWIELREPVGFDEHGGDRVMLQREDGGVEALDMPHLETKAAFGRRAAEPVRFIDGLRDRLLKKDVFSSRQRLHRHRVMGARAGGNGDRIGPAQQFCHTCRCTRSALRRHLPGSLRVKIKDSGEHRTGDIRKHLGVK